MQEFDVTCSLMPTQYLRAKRVNFDEDLTTAKYKILTKYRLRSEM